MIAMLLAAAVLAPPVNCRPRELFRRQAGQSCITAPTIAPTHAGAAPVDGSRRPLKPLMKDPGQSDPALTARIQADLAKAMAVKGIRRRYGAPNDPAPFRRFDARPAPKVSPYAQ